MVSFWPWGRDSSSTASFEKTLSALSVNITQSQARLEKLRSSSRRVRVIWTLYLTFAYLVYAIVLILVIGQPWGTYEWAGLAGGPVFIYALRYLLATYYSVRIDSIESRLKEYQAERAKTIQKLKDATKYDSTLELIEKYGGQPGGKPSGGKDSKGSKKQSSDESKRMQEGTPRRTTMPPPPTANIQQRPLEDPSRALPGSPQTQTTHSRTDQLEPTAEFAPNAEYTQQPPQQHPSNLSPPQPPPQQPHFQPSPPESHWYDRIFDVLLGEDESAPKNRIVLLCQSCRLVNGQAPPGTKTLADVGLWKCMACGASNGEVEDDEGRRIIREVLDERANTADGDDNNDDAEEEEGGGGADIFGKDAVEDPVSVDSLSDGPAASVRRRRTAAAAKA